MFLPTPLGGETLIAWRLDQARFAPTWDSGEGAFQVGGRWNSAGTRAVYCSIDASTAILEVAVHKGFSALDVVPHILSAVEILDRKSVHIVLPEQLPDAEWLVPGVPRAAQQAYGDTLLERHGFFVVPSAVSSQSWNLVFLAARDTSNYVLRKQIDFVLDPRLHG